MCVSSFICKLVFSSDPGLRLRIFDSWQIERKLSNKLEEVLTVCRELSSSSGSATSFSRPGVGRCQQYSPEPFPGISSLKICDEWHDVLELSLSRAPGDEGMTERSRKNWTMFVDA
jgi:hypothetical protein